MKIRLIEPEPPGMHVWAKVLLPRLGLPIIAATLKEHGHDVLVYNPTMAPIDWDDVNSSDLVGLSSTTSTATTAYEFADDLRARGIPVVIGGSHVTFMADEALEHVDYVARGEGGEQLMLELIEALDGDRELDSIDGLSFTRDGEAVHNPPRAALADLDELPFPDLRLLVGSDKLTTMPIMTSWGCPFDCTFCSVTAMFGKKYRFRSAESVIAELKDKRPERIFFYDDNMAANRKRLKKLLQMMIDEGLVIPWSAQVRTDVVRDPELLDLMRRSGCQLVYLGLESVNQETLDRFEKSQTVADIEKAIKVLHDYGIKSHGMFVLGADDDDVQTVRDTVAFAIKNKIDTVMLNILTPLPGTQQFEEFDDAGRIFDKRWELYDAHHVVFEPARMTPYELQIEVLRGYMRFYSLRTWLRYIFTLQFTKQLLFHWWGMVIIRNWRKDERNKAFIKALKRMWPRPRRAAPCAAPASIDLRRRVDERGAAEDAAPLTSAARPGRHERRAPDAPAGTLQTVPRGGPDRLSGRRSDVKVSYLSLVSAGHATGSPQRGRFAQASRPKGGDAVNGKRRIVTLSVLLGTLLLSLALTTSAFASPVTSKKAQLREVQAKLQDVYHQVDMAVEKYNQATTPAHHGPGADQAERAAAQGRRVQPRRRQPAALGARREHVQARATSASSTSCSPPTASTTS